MPGTFYMPVSAPVEAVRPRTDSTSESSTSKTDSDNPGFDKILECKTKEVVHKSEGVEESSNDKSKRPRTRSIKRQDHSKPESQPSAMENTLSKVFGENRDLAMQTASDPVQSMNGFQPEISSNGNNVIINPIAVDTVMQNSDSGIISNFNGITHSNEKVFEGIGPPGMANSPPPDSMRIETAGPRGKDQNPQPEITRFTEEADTSKAQREVSVKTTPVFDWVRRNFKTPAGEITRGDTDRFVKPVIQDFKPAVANSSSDPKQSLTDELPNSQPVFKATGDSNAQLPTDIQREINPAIVINSSTTDINRIATGQNPELVSQNVKPAETVGSNTEQPPVNTFNDSKPEVEIIQGSITLSTEPVASDAALNRESMRVETDKVPKVEAQEIKPKDDVPPTGQQDIKSRDKEPQVDVDKAPKVALQEIKSTDEVPRTAPQEILSGKEVPRVETEVSVKPPVQNEPVPKQEISSGEAVHKTVNGNSDSAIKSAESVSAGNPEQKSLNLGVKAIDSTTQKVITPQSENPAPAVQSISNAGNPSTIPASASDQPLIDIKVDEPVSVLGNAPVRIATEIRESAADELPLGGKAVLKIELSPPRLGRMNIELVKTEGGIDVKMLVRTAFARDLLMQRGEEIKTALHDQGIDIKRFNIVETGNSRENAHQNMSGFESNTSSHQNDGHFRESQETADYSLQIPDEKSDEDGLITDSVQSASNRDNSGRVNILA
jgi:flagellar hook-length control protein FliK